MLLSKTAWEPNIFSKECYSMKMDLLTNATVVDDAIRFVAQKSLDSINREDKKEESNQPDYDEDKDRLEDKQEEEVPEMTTNKVF